MARRVLTRCVMNRALTLAVLLSACASGGAAPVLGDGGTSNDAAPCSSVEASAELDGAGGAIAARADDAHAYLSIPAGALPRRTLVTLRLVPTSAGGREVELAPALDLERAAELRVTCEDGALAWRIDEHGAHELDTRVLPGALVIRTRELGGRYHFGLSPPLPE